MISWHQLDACAKEYNFPVLDNGHIYPVTSGISVFGDMQPWVNIVEVVGYHDSFHGHNVEEDCLYIYGNCFRFKPGINKDNVLSPYLHLVELRMLTFLIHRCFELHN